VSTGLIRPGSPAPEIALATAEGTTFTAADLLGRTTVLVFYPSAFSPVCSDQLQIYDEVGDEFARRGATLYGVSTDSTWAQAAFVEKLRVAIPQLSDFEPKGATSRRLGAYLESAGTTNRAIVVFGPDAVVRWSHLAASPAELPGANLILDALDASA